MASEAKIPSTTEAWETGALGQNEKHVRRAPEGMAEKIDGALGLQAISIRLPKAVIDTYKMLAKMHGCGYQPLMRDALCRFADGEMKQLLLGAVEVQRQRSTRAPAKASSASEEADAPPPRRKLKKAA